MSIALAVSLAGVACDTSIHFPGSGGPDAFVSASCREAENHSDFEFVRDQVLATSCANFTSCHQGNNPPGRLSLSRTRAYDQLVGVTAITVPDWVRVVPGDPEASYLLVKMGAIEGPLGEEGGFMPPNSPLICAEKMGAVRRWIAAGALPATPDAGP